MKKLLLFALVFSTARLAAQNPSPPNSLAVFGGPNWFQQFSGGIVGSAELNARMGYTVGVEYTRRFSPRWQWTTGFRFHRLNFMTESGPLTWPSEWQNGQYVYDSSLPHFITTKGGDRAWQLLGGIRRAGKSRAWSWYGGLEAGMTGYIPESGSPRGPVRLTVGALAGVEWRPRRFGVFVQPAARYVFQRFGRNEFQGFRFLIPAVEAGARFHF